MGYNFTVQQIAAVKAMLPDDDDDERLLHDSLEGLTDLHEYVGKLLSWNEDDEGVVNALAEQIDDRKARQERAKNRIATRRDMIKALMEIAGIDKLTLPEATISHRVVAPKVIFPNIDMVPDQYCKFDRKLDREKLKAIDLNSPDGLPSWATMDNGGTSITVRRK